MVSCLWICCLGPHAFYGPVALALMPQNLIALFLSPLPSWGLMSVGLLPFGSHVLVPMVLLPSWGLMPEDLFPVLAVKNLHL